MDNALRVVESEAKKLGAKIGLKKGRNSELKRPRSRTARDI